MPEGLRPIALAAAVALLPTPHIHAQATPRLDQVSWLTGCWEASNGPRTIEERWMAPRGGSMIGVGRTVRDNTLRDYELVLLTEKDGRLAYEAHPAGQATNTFMSSLIADTAVIFEDPKHDFPQRVGYVRRGPDSLVAWIDGVASGASRRAEFPYRRVACD